MADKPKPKPAYKPPVVTMERTEDGITAEVKQYDYFSKREAGQTKPVAMPDWALRVTRGDYSVPADVKVIKQALDLFNYNDGVLWTAGAIGSTTDDPTVGTTIHPANHRFLIDYIPHDGEDDEREPEFRGLEVTQRVCAVGSIQLLMGIDGPNGADPCGDHPDYNTIIARLNEISHRMYGDGSVSSLNDTEGLEHVKAVFTEYVREYGGSIEAH